jgi:hypothetical protein
VHAPERVTLVGLDRRFIEAVAAKVERRTTISISVNEGELYVDLGGESFSTQLVRQGFPTGD